MIGNTSVDEFWKTPAGQLQGTLAWKNAECCVAYNLMKLKRLVFGWTADARWMDAYERALFNCRLGTQESRGLKLYFVPLAAGYWRDYNTPEESFWCCTGTGAEESAKFADTIYFHRGADLYVNQFLASPLEWKDEGFAIEQSTRFPIEQGTTLKITSSRPHIPTIHVRIPAWTTSGAEVTINGRPLEAVSDPGSYLAIRRTWQEGDTIGIRVPMELRTEPLAGDDTVCAALFGPVVLAADLGAGPQDGPTRLIHDPFPKEIPPPDPLPRIAVRADTNAVEWIQPASISEMRFRAKREGTIFSLMPLYQIRDQRYAVYWQLNHQNIQ
ncbi:glycoside hydrolase family 127 protein [Occallatibacter riparius]|uniref:Glycoside hydrolase family 127 protein n=1 Tax=Occallatibacter riparius TaxID=1002689 RepID=A0A9J7BVW7_9BACT|nr:glycoside hydrolase family 127 protein [Occallatibacter riparius]UWZ86847.1 glycoside hydrolase family 127 protein [Occallatibacter riparius]